MLEEDNVRQGFLEQDQYERLLEELPANLKALFVCGYHTGARKNEFYSFSRPNSRQFHPLDRTKGQTTGGGGNSTSPLVACPVTPPLKLRKAIKTPPPTKVVRIRRNVPAPRAHAHPKNGYPFDSGERNRPG